MKTKYSKRYLKGFREGFNNHKQYLQSERLVTSNDELIQGIIAGVCKRRQRISENKHYLLCNDKEIITEAES